MGRLTSPNGGVFIRVECGKDNSTWSTLKNVTVLTELSYCAWNIASTIFLIQLNLHFLDLNQQEFSIIGIFLSSDLIILMNINDS